jgi:YVTN family beta-propeller protein
LISRLAISILALLSMGQLSKTEAVYEIYVSNERAGTVTILDGRSLQPLATVAVGSRPRGINASAESMWH